MSLLRVALASAVMAIGAVINGGCYLGSILYLGRGKSNFLFSLLGIALAARADVSNLAGVAGAHSRIVFTLLAGFLAGVLMHRLPGWGYNSALASLGRIGLAPADLKGIVMACALFAGAVASCIAAGQWRPDLPDVRGAARCLGGGFLLESAAHAIPGGNDGLLFWAMPGLAAYGFLAYAVILSVLLLVWSAATRRARM